MHTYMHTCMHTHTHIYTHTDIHMYTYIYAHTHTHIHKKPAGVPTVTVAGERMGARLSASSVLNVGAGWLVARNLADYEDLAVALARKLERGHRGVYVYGRLYVCVCALLCFREGISLHVLGSHICS
jgi:predicted O-linked N-acetylglucosamine transferase (SPINDLY family)